MKIRRYFSCTAWMTLFALLMVCSCIDRELFEFDRLSDRVALNPSFAGPVAYGSMSLENLLEKVDSAGMIDSDENGLLYLTYRKELLSLEANEVVHIPTQTYLQYFISSDVNIPAFIFSQLGDTVYFEKKETYVFTFENQERIDSALFKSGQLDISVASSFRHSGILTITSDDVFLNGEPFSQVIRISDASGSFSENINRDLAGSTISLETGGDSSVLVFDFKLELINSGAGVTTDESCDITLFFSDLEFSELYGYIGQYELMNINDEITIELLNMDFDGDISFADPRLKLIFDNSYGLPVRVDLKDIHTCSDNTGEQVDLDLDPSINPYDLGAPDISQAGSSVRSVININDTTSNIREAIDSEPNRFFYHIVASANPAGDPSVSNFVFDTSRIETDLEIMLPMDLRISEFTLEDTLEMDFKENISEESDMVDYLLIRLDTENGFPIDLDLQGYFTDSAYVVLDSLITTTSGKVLSAGTLDQEGGVDQAGSNRTEIIFDRTRVEGIEDTKYIIFSAGISTAEQGTRDVKFYTDYTLEFRLAMSAEFDLDPEDQK